MAESLSGRGGLSLREIPRQFCTTCGRQGRQVAVAFVGAADQDRGRRIAEHSDVLGDQGKAQEMHGRRLAIFTGALDVAFGNTHDLGVAYLQEEAILGTAQLAERGQLVQGPNLTEVVMIEAQLLGIEDLGEGYMASIEFSGMIREEPNTSPSPFREVWNMTKPKTGDAGWLVAGVQALQ